MLLDKTPVADEQRPFSQLARETPTDVVFHVFDGCGVTPMEYAGDGMLGIFLEPGGELQAGCFIHAANNIDSGQAEFAAGQCPGFVEHHGIDGVH